MDARRDPTSSVCRYDLTMRRTSDETIAQIKRLAAQGMKGKEIATRLGVSYSVVHKYGGVKSNAERGIGDRYSRLVIIARLPGGKAVCRCDCGNEITVQMGALKHPTSPQKSCGCLARELTEKSRADMTGIVLHGYVGVRYSRPGGRNGNGAFWTVRCSNGHEFETARKKWMKGEITCQECAAGRRAEREQAARALRIRRTLADEKRRAMRAAEVIARSRLREIRRSMSPIRAYARRHAFCDGTHSLGLGRTVSCAEYEAERRRQSLAQNGTGTPREYRGPRKRSFDFPPAVRSAILNRDRHSCLRCGRGVRDLDDGERLEADHIYSGVGSSLDDGQTLCSTCHAWKHKTRKRDGLCFVDDETSS